MATLFEWHRRLAAHFEALHSDRASGTQRNLFALEHNLDLSEISELQENVRQAVHVRAPESNSPLPWVVYATELGYRYSGDEYWQTFEDETPGWSQYWNRSWLRNQFAWFHKTYGGVKPVGGWAQHFSIICWPIANAILPRDLQVQLSRVLYEMAYKLNSNLLTNPEQLGAVIAGNSWGTSPRFQNLAQERLLIGQIAAALLLEGETNSKSLILPSTLRRIGADLDREQQSKEWLKRARRIAVERFKTKGLLTTTFDSARTSQSREIKEFSLEPTFLLRPTVGKTNSWSVLLELPDLSPILEVVPESQNILLNSRCIVSGTDARPLARGRLLRPNQRVVLHDWPEAGKPLLTFEEKSDQLDLILRNRVAMPSLEVWIFRIASDGIAYPVRTASVRPGQNYLLLRHESPIGDDSDLVAQEVNCSGVQIYLLQIPNPIATETINRLKDLSISISTTLSIRPAGVPPIKWDGEGRSEWLTVDQPSFSIHSDRAIESLQVVSEIERCNLGPLVPGEPIFLILPTLSPGRHEVTLEAKHDSHNLLIEVGRLEIYSRPARAWEPGKGVQGPLLLDLDPRKPTLEQLRDGKVSVSVTGEIGRKLNVKTKFFGRGSDDVILERDLPRLPLPIGAEEWNAHLQKYLFANGNVADVYDSIVRCDMELHGQELGILVLRFDRESASLRWAARIKERVTQITIVSDATQDHPVEVIFRPFPRPDLPEHLPSEELMRWYTPPDCGGLLMAEVNGMSSGIIVPPKVHELKDFRFYPVLLPRGKTIQEARFLLNEMLLWGAARLTGNAISWIRQRSVLRLMSQTLHSTICGDAWSSIENTSENLKTEALLFPFRDRPMEREIAEDILSTVLVLKDMSIKGRIEWLYEECRPLLNMPRIHRTISLPDGTKKDELVGAGTATEPLWLCEFVLRLASDPNRLIHWCGDQLHPAFTEIFGRPALVRLARLVILVLDRSNSKKDGHVGLSLYAGWNW